MMTVFVVYDNDDDNDLKILTFAPTKSNQIKEKP
jgi:hypothetical protein